MTNLNDNFGDLDLEYQDAVKDPNDPTMQAIEQSVPEKYKGKSVDDLIAMHVNIEKVMARQGNELGQLRRITDSQNQLLSQAITNKNQTAQPATPSITAEKLLDDPVTSINTAVQSNPEIAQIKAEQARLAREQAVTRFEANHPTYKDDVQDPQFQEWVLKSPLRSNLLASLNQYNTAAGEQLWELWREHSAAKSASEAARQGRVAAASVTKTGTAEPAGKKTFSRAKLAQLLEKVNRGDPQAVAMFNDPGFQAEYQSAYAEDRVR